MANRLPGELGKDVGVGQHVRSIQSKDTVDRSRQRVHRQSRWRIVPQHSGAQQRVQVGAVVRMPVADQHCVHFFGRRVPQQPR
jgi:hypothetical protein